MYRDYTHLSDYGRLLVAYQWYAQLMGLEKIETVKVDALPANLHQDKSMYPAMPDYTNTQEMKEEAGQLLEENADLEQKIENADSVQGVMDYAESELDYVDPDTTFYEPQASEDN